eukprot:2812529-Pyramimonas_sp.AAC.1
MALRDTPPTLKINLSKRLVQEEDDIEHLRGDRRRLPINMAKLFPISAMRWQTTSYQPNVLPSTKVVLSDEGITFHPPKDDVRPKEKSRHDASAD